MHAPQPELKMFQCWCQRRCKLDGGPGRGGLVVKLVNSFIHLSPGSTQVCGQGVTKTCRLSWLTSSVLVYEPIMRGVGGKGGWVSGIEYSSANRAQINFGYLTPYLTYVCSHRFDFTTTKFYGSYVRAGSLADLACRPFFKYAIFRGIALLVIITFVALQYWVTVDCIIIVWIYPAHPPCVFGNRDPL